MTRDSFTKFERSAKSQSSASLTGTKGRIKAAKARREADPRIKVGARHGHWTIIKPLEGTLHNGKFLCRCSCGTERYVSAANLIYGGSTSCRKGRPAKNDKAHE